MKQGLKRIGEIALLLAISGWIIWSFIASTIWDYERLKQTHSSSEALWTIVQQRSVGLLIVVAVFLVGGWLATWLRGRLRARVYWPQADDKVLYRNDFTDEPALVLRRDQLFLFRGNRPDVLRRLAINDCKVQFASDGITLRVNDDTDNVWNYHWILEEGQVDVSELCKWVTYWLAGHAPVPDLTSRSVDSRHDL